MEVAWGHIGINVTDLVRSLSFYTDVLGFEVLGQSKDAERPFAFLGAGGKFMVTLWQQSQGTFDTNRPGLHHLAFQATSRAEVEAVEERLRSIGATLYHDGIVAHREGAGSGGIFFEDPDGTRLEVYAPKGMEEETAPSGKAPTCGFF